MPTPKYRSTRQPTLRSHLFRVLLVAVAIPLLINSGVGARREYVERRHATQARLTRRSAGLQIEVDDYLSRHRDAIFALAATMPHVAKADTRQAAFRAYHQAYPGFLTMIATDSGGRVQFALRQNGAVEAPASGDSVADREYFRKAMESRSGYVSGAFRGRQLGNDPVVAISWALVGSTGAAAGVIEGSLDLERLRQFEMNPRIPGQSIAVLDADRRIVYSSPELRLDPLEDLSHSDLGQAHAGRTFRWKRHDQEYIAGEARMASLYGWKVLVLEPAAAQTRALLWDWGQAVCGEVLLAFVLCLAAAGVAARGLTQPLRGTAERVRRLAEDVTAGDGRNDGAGREAGNTPAEIAELNTGIEIIASRLRSSYSELRQVNERLEQRVDLRTRALNRYNAQLNEAIRQEARAREELALFKRAVEAASEGVVIFDAQGRGWPLVYANTAFEALTGYSAAEVQGRNPQFLTGEETNPAVMTEVHDAMRNQRSCAVEILLYRKDGSSFWNHISITPIFAADGRVSHFVALQFDITHHKEIERLKDELVSTVSHELRTPLTSLHGFAELILNREFPPERSRKFLEIIYRESRRLTELINDFLDLQRIESGIHRFEIERFDVARVIAEAAQLAGEMPGREVTITMATGLPMAMADRRRVRQVLDNLISNACKFSPGGEPIEISAGKDGNEIIVSVRDYGIGIPAEAIPKLFTRFYRVDNTATRKIGGTGLGLELARKLVEGQHGRIWVASELGAGSIFRFSLPAAPYTEPDGPGELASQAFETEAAYFR